MNITDSLKIHLENFAARATRLGYFAAAARTFCGSAFAASTARSKPTVLVVSDLQGYPK